MQEQYDLTDIPMLLGAGVTPADLTDDALGRALDKGAQAGGATVFSAVATRALLREQVLADAEPRFVHWDSTSRSVWGAYRKAPGAVGIQPTYGHSKDHRPDVSATTLGSWRNTPGGPALCC